MKLIGSVLIPTVIRLTAHTKSQQDGTCPRIIMSRHINAGRSPLDECQNSKQMYKSISTWRTHLIRKHSSMNDGTNLIMCNPDTLSDINNEPDQVQNSENGTMEESNDNVITGITDSCSKTLAMYLTLKTIYFVSEVALNVIIDGIREVNYSYLANKRILALLKDHNIISEEILQKLNYFEEAHKNSSGKLRSTFKRNQYYKDEFKFVSPRLIDLGQCNNRIHKN